MGNHKLNRYSGYRGNGHEMQNQNADVQNQVAPVYIMVDPKNPEGNAPQLFTSTKQIQQESQRILAEWSNKDQEPAIWGFKELLTWKIPEHLLSTAARESQSRLKRK